MQAMLIIMLLVRYLYFCLCFLLNKTQVLISAIIVATCKTTRTAITASSEVELPLLLVVSHEAVISMCMEIKQLDTLVCTVVICYLLN